MPVLRLSLLQYFYPRPPRGGRPDNKAVLFKALCISIHALREEGDAKKRKYLLTTTQISIHALREEGDDFLLRDAGVLIISIHALREEGDCA